MYIDVNKYIKENSNNHTTTVKDALDEYLEFDSSEIFKNGDPLIFGGALRDGINGDLINDVDIVCGSETKKKLSDFLISLNWVKLNPKLGNVDLSEIYKGISIINQPTTFMNTNGKIIQLIRPANKTSEFIISNVDISCCAVSYDGIQLKSHYPNALIHCIIKRFKINEGGMYNDRRTEMRVHKLREKSYVRIRSDREETELIREYKLNLMN